ncbi:hypothetical protein K3N28_06145 [Glycomyces sp. TRM65418]|uniref:hypothetical protein n=1 Tax=Glycomyces sp. TRM65418 TaxID=2867006 RepID=UPI001CE4E2CD|nr:hypothetical protein [Glycomyces sp. TRM65418]MCC3762650.1 hypothetical protein [Glycomyces sp. TRM65418]QZD56687.1 hypothetical protein K3N28_06105 [Glycomyces sp. TRM65418]
MKLSDLRFGVSEEILQSDPYGIAPSPDNQFATFTIEGTYNGSTSSALWLDFTFGMWADGAFYLPCPASTPQDIYFTPEVSGGNAVSGTVCTEIPTDVENVVAYLEQVNGKQTRTFIAVDANAPEEIPTNGTRSKAPLPAGSAAQVGDWMITPSQLQFDAVQKGDGSLYGVITPGRQIVSYNVSGTYSGPGIGSLSLEVEVGIWVDGAFYPEGCEATFPDYWADAPDVEAGGTASGTACAEIPEDLADTSDLLFYVGPADGFGSSVYFIEVD